MTSIGGPTQRIAEFDAAMAEDDAAHAPLLDPIKAKLSGRDKDPRIPSIAAASGCHLPQCPGVSNFVVGFGNAGGGRGVYVFCRQCGEVRGKDCMPDD